MPSSLLEEMRNNIPPKLRKEFGSSFVELKEGQFLDQEFTLLSPVFQIQNLDELVVQHKTLKDVGATEGSFIKK